MVRLLRGDICGHPGRRELFPEKDNSGADMGNERVGKAVGESVYSQGRVAII